MNIFETKIKPLLVDKHPLEEIDSEDLVKAAEQIAKGLSVNGPRHNQIRKFYDAVKQIERHTLKLTPEKELEEEHKAQLLFLRPHLANAQRKDSRIKRLREVLDLCLVSDVIKTKADLIRFVKFFESIVAYTRR